MLSRQSSEDRVGLVLGALLFVAGGAALVAQAVNWELPEDGWPWVIIVPGIALLVAGLLLRGDGGTALTVAGCVVSTVGGILLYQNTTDNWESWAFAWALVGPTAPGVGLLLSGLVQGRRNLVDVGARLALLGVTLFAVFYVFMVWVIGVGSEQPRDIAPWALPLVLVGLGAVVVGRAILLPHRAADATTAPGNGGTDPTTFRS
jgi:hypothetical protein